MASIGQQIGNYRLVKLLGSGGFADVYLGQHIHVTNMQAAIKIMHATLAKDNFASFLEEAETLSKLRHPNIIRIYDFGIEPNDNTPYLVMEYCQKGTLRQSHPKGTIVPL